MTVNISILLVEDELRCQQMLVRRLKKSHLFHAEIDVAETLMQSKVLLRCKLYDIIILDLRLPDSNGIETIHKVKELSNGTPIIPMTGHVDHLDSDDHIIDLPIIRAGACPLYLKSERIRLLEESILREVERVRVKRVERNSYSDRLSTRGMVEMFARGIAEGCQF